MANAQLLEEYRKGSGKTKSFLAVKMNISRPYLYRLLKHPERCTMGQAKQLCDELIIKKPSDRDEIFLP